MEKKKYYINDCGETIEVFPKLFLYPVRDMIIGKKMENIGICLDYMEEDVRVPYCYLTVTFGEFLGKKNSAYIDINHCTDFAKQLLADFGAKDTGLTKRGGFCEYPLYIFDEKLLRELGGELYDQYSDQYEAYMKMFEEE